MEEEEEVPLNLVELGDICRVGVNMKVPVDGVVLSGEFGRTHIVLCLSTLMRGNFIMSGKSSVDESMVTGEAMPVFKFKGS